MDIVGALAGFVGLIAVYTGIAVVVMRHYVRAVPLLQLTAIALGAFTTMGLVLFVVYSSAMRGGAPASSTPGVLVIAALFIPGMMISQILKRRGIAMPFPGIGARVMFAIMAIQIVLSLAIFLLFFRH